MKQVITIEKRCEVGTCVSRPFKVKAEDDHIYWLKGCGSGWTRRELCYELLAARMATELGLPIAHYELLDVSAEILEFCAVPEIRDLRAGPAFGSLHVADGASLLPVTIKDVPESLRWKILLFDWWIQNADRILGKMGGNVNLLWSPNSCQLTVIDHNNAFDNTFDETAFFDNHVFRDERNRIPAPFLLEQTASFANITARLPELIDDFPSEWTECEGSLGDFLPNSVIEILHRFDKLLTVFGGEHHE
jgi:hypothetical protein